MTKDHYLGNPLLRKAFSKREFTSEEFTELVKCQQDVVYFAKKYVKIITLDEGLTEFEPWDFQLKLLHRFHHNRFNICKLPRQVGKSLCVSVYLLWYAIFNDSVNIAILANKADTAKEIFTRKLQPAYENLPDFLQQGVVSWNKQSIELENKSKIVASSSSSSSIRGGTFNIVVLDEFAFVENNSAENFIRSVFPVISSGKKSKIIIISCVVEDTFVFTDKGIKQIKNFIDYTKDGGYEINNYSIYGKNKLNSGNLFFNNGKAPTKIIETTSSKLECSDSHKLWACKDGIYGWFKSEELEVGDYISIKYGMNIWGNNDIIEYSPQIERKCKNIFTCNKITSNIAYFLGLFIAEGYARKFYNNEKHIGGQVIITCGDDISQSIENIGLKSSCKDGLHYTINSKMLVNFIEFLGFDITKKSPEKIIPDRLLEMSKENIISLIQGIMDGDGFSRKDNGYVGIGLSSKKLILQIRMLLMNFGILTDYYEVLTRPTEKVKVESMNYRIQLNYHESKKYYDLIGFKFKRKQLNENILNIKNLSMNNADNIPFSKEFFSNFNSKEFKKLELFSGSRKKHLRFSRKYLLDKKEDLINLNEPKITEFLDNNVDINLKWEPIKTIQDSENYVYDFSLPHDSDDKFEWCHSVLYNGVVGHQTPNGLNFFYKYWKNAVDGKSDFIPTEVHWTEVPGRDEKWKEEVLSKMTQTQFDQEYESVGKETCINVMENGKLKTIEIGKLYESFETDKKYDISENPI